MKTALLLLLTQLPAELPIAPQPTVGQTLLNLLLSPSGIATSVTLILSGVGLFVGTNEVRRRRVALAIHHGFLIAEDIAAEIPGPDAFDKVAAALKAADEFALANGWRALKPGEQTVAKLEFSALHGEQKISEKLAIKALEAVPPKPQA